MCLCIELGHKLLDFVSCPGQQIKKFIPQVFQHIHQRVSQSFYGAHDFISDLIECIADPFSHTLSHADDIISILIPQHCDQRRTCDHSQYDLGRQTSCRVHDNEDHDRCCQACDDRMLFCIICRNIQNTLADNHNGLPFIDPAQIHKIVYNTYSNIQRRHIFKGLYAPDLLQISADDPGGMQQRLCIHTLEH